MKKMFLLALGVASFSACKKDSDNVPTEVKTITAPNWRVSAVTITTTVATTDQGKTTTVSSTVDDFPLIPACRKDDFLKFDTNNNLTVDEGPTKCGNTDPQKITKKWEFKTNRTQLMITPATAPQSPTQDIVELSDKTLRLRQLDAAASGNTVTTTVTNTTYTAF